MKTNELTGEALDWAVAKCENKNISLTEFQSEWERYNFAASIDWAQGGAIIEREEISISREFISGRIEWAAWTPAPYRDDSEAFGYGKTALVAAMRCYVASKLGDEIEVPEELLDFAHE